MQRLVPIAAESLVDETMANREHSWDYIYEPTTKELLDGLMGRYVESIVYQGVVEKYWTEQSARMVAMKAATDNAGNQLTNYNWFTTSCRQAAITRKFRKSLAVLLLFINDLHSRRSVMRVAVVLA